MSSIDERIVRMKWDDSDFSKAAQNTLKLLENVESSVQNLSKVITNPYTTALKTMESVADGMKKVSSSIGDTTKGISGGVQSALKGFSSIDDSIKRVGSGLSGMFTKVDVSPVEEAAAKVSNAFTLSGRIVNKALDEIASKAVGIGETVANALMINPVSSGFQEYGLLMDSTQVILSNTGRPLEDVNKTLEELNHYADKTIYNFAEMTNAIGRFSAAGVGLEDSTAAIEGLSNLSALVGANAQQNISAMDATSKALASGSLKLRQWMQFEAAGSLGGKVFRDELVKTAQEMGYFSQSWNDATGKSIDGAELLSEAQTSFRETLKYGWVDSQVLLTTLSKFSDETTELGQKAIKAATEVRTFSKMWDAMQEAVQSSWSQSFQYIFGDYNEGVNLWTSINEEIGGLLAKFNDARNDMLKVWHDDGGRDAMIEGIATTYHKLGDALKPIGDAMRDSFSWLGLDATERGNILINASNAFRDWAKGLTLSENRAAKLYNVFTLLRVPVNNFKDFVESNGIKNLAATFHNVTGAVLNLANSFANAFRSVLGENMFGKGAIFADATKALKGISASVYQLTARSGILLKNAKKGTHEIHSWESIFSNLLTPIRAILNAFKSINVQDVIAIGSDAFKIFASVIDRASVAVKNFFDYLPTDVLGKAVSQLRSYIREIREYTNSIKGSKQIGNVFSGVSRIASGLFSIIVKISSIVSKIIADFTRSGGFMAIAKTWVNLRRAVVDFGNIFLDVVQKKFGSNISMIETRIAKVKGAFEAITKVIQRVSQLSLFGEVDKDTGKIEGIEKTIFSLSGIIDRLLSPVQYLFELFQQVDFDNITRIGVNAFKSLLAIVNAASISIDKFFGTLDASWLGSIIEDLRQATKAVREFLESPEGQEIMIHAFDMIATSINRLLDVLAYVYDAGKNIITEFTESGGFQSILNIFTNLSQAAANFVDIIKNAIAGEFGEQLDGAGSLLASVLSILETISNTILSISTLSLFGDLNEETGTIEGTKRTIYSLQGIIQGLISPIKYIIDLITAAKPVNFYRIFTHVIKSSITIIGTATSSLKNFFESLDTSWFRRFIEDIRQATKHIRLFLQSAKGQEMLTNFFNVFTGVAHIAYDVLVQVFGVIHKIMNSELFKSGVDAVVRISSAVLKLGSTVINAFDNFLQKHKVVKKAFDTLGELMKPLFEAAIMVLNTIADCLDKLSDGINWSKFFPESASSAIEKIQQGLGWLKEKASGIGTYISEQFSGMKDGLDENQSIFDVFASRLVDGLDSLKKKLANAGGAVFEALKGAIFGYEVSASTLTDETSEEAAAEVEKSGFSIIESLTSLGDKAKSLLNGGKEGKTIGNALTEFFKKIKIKAGDALEWANENYHVLINALSTAANKVGSWASKIPGKILDAIFGGQKKDDGSIAKGALGWLIEGVDHFIKVDLGGRITDLFNRYETELTPLKTVIEGIIAVIKPIFGEISELYFTSIGSLSDFFGDKHGNITFSTVFDRLSSVLTFIRKIKLLGLLGAISDLTKQSGGVVRGFKKNSKKISENIATILGTIGDKNGGFLMTIANSIKKFPDSISTFLNTTTKDLLDKLVNPFDKFFNETMKKPLARLAKGADKSRKILTKTLDRFMNGVDKSIGQVAKGTKRYLTGKAINEVAAGLLKFAVAVGVLALALYGLSLIPTDQLKKGGIALAAIMGALLAVAVVLVLVTRRGKKKIDLADTALEGFKGTVIQFGDAVGDAIKGFQKALSKLAAIGLILSFIFAIKGVIDGIKEIGELQPEQAIIGLIGMTVVMIALSSAIKKILEASKTGIGEKGTTFRQILAMLAMMAVIKTAIASVLTVGDMSWGEMLKGVIGVSAVMIAFAFTMKLIYESTLTGFGVKGTSVRQILELLAMVFAIKTLTNAVVKIGELPMEKIIAAGLVVGALVNMFSKDLVVLNMTDGKGHTGEILAMAAAIWVMADAVKKIAKLDTGDAVVATICIAALMGVFAFAIQAASNISKGAVAAIAVIGLISGALMVVLTILSDQLNDDQATRFEKVANSLVSIMGAFSIALIACGVVGKICKGADVTSGLLSMVKVILIIVAVLTAVGAIFNVLDSAFNGAASAALDKVVDIFEKLGQLIGKFVGGIVGGFQEAKAKSLEKVGSSLTKFAENAKPFLDLVGDTKKLKEITKGVESLAGAILKIAAGDIIRRLNSLTGGGSNSFDRFSEMLKTLAPALKDFGKQIDDVNTKKVGRALESFGELVKVARKIPNEGGIIADIFGDNSLGSFAEGLSDFTPKFARFLNSMKATNLFGDSRKSVKRAIEFANDVAEFASHIPSSGGIIQNIFGDHSLTDFATGLAQFTPAFGGFLDAMKTQNLIEGDNAANVQKAIDFANQLVKFAVSIPDTSEYVSPDGSIFTDDKLSSFARGLAAFTPEFKTFLDTMSKYDYGKDGEEKVDKAIGYARAIVRFVRKLPQQELKISPILGIQIPYNSLSEFAKGLGDFTTEFTTFLDKTSTFDYGEDGEEKVDKAIGYARSLFRFVRKLPQKELKVSWSGITIPFNELSQLATGLGDFTEPFTTFLTKVTEADYDDGKVTQAIKFARAAARMAQMAPKFGGLKDVWTGTTSLKTFGDDLGAFAPGFARYLTTVGNASYDDSVVEKSNTLMQSLSEIAGTVKGKESVLKAFLFGDDSLTGIGEGLGKFATAMSDYSTALDAVNWDNADKANSFIENLADLADRAISINNLMMIPLDPIVQKINDQLKALENDDKSVEEIKGSSEFLGDVISQGIQNGFDVAFETTKSTVDTTITDWLNELKGTVDGQLDTNSESTANTLIGVLEEDIHRVRDDLDPKVYADFTILMGRGVLAVEDKYNDFYNAGAYAMDGLINGIASREQEVYTRLDNLAIAMANTMQAGLDEHSPSKIFDKFGQFVPMGLSNGIVKAAPDALNTLRDSLIRPINAMAGMLNGDIEYSPKITPIVDLTGARASVGTLNGMFGSRSIDVAGSTMRLSSANAKARRAATARVYNDKNVVNAIDGLKGDIAALGGSIKNMGLYMDGDTLVGTIVDKVDKKLGTNQIRRKRYA